jgi:Zn-dependent protease
MPLFGSFSIGRWFGFKVRIDYSWFLIFGLVVWTFSALTFPHQLRGLASTDYYAMGTAAALLLFLSVLLHELAHSVVARSRGVEVEGITLFIFGGVAQTKSEPQRPIDEFLITVVGPLTSLALAGLFWGAEIAADFYAWPAAVGAVAANIAILNLVLALFNLVPGFPLDGGRIFRSLVWQITGDLDRATRWATLGGRVFGYALMMYGFLLIFQGYFPNRGFSLNGAWMAIIGWFLARVAASSYHNFRMRAALAGVPVSQVMASHPVTMPGHISVQEAIDQFFMRRPYSAYPVMENDRVVGLLSVERVSDVEAAERGSTPVSSVMRPLEEIPTADESATLDDILPHMEPKTEGRALIVRDGQVLGILTLGDVSQGLRRVQILGTPLEHVEES